MTGSKPEKRSSIGARRNPASQSAILDAAETVLRENGLAGFSIEAVARLACAGKPTIYRWWPSRAALILDVYQRFKSQVAFPDTGNLVDDLTALLAENIIGFWSAGICGSVFRSIIAEAQTSPEAAEALGHYLDARRTDVASLFARARARGEIDPNGSDLVAADLIVGFAWHRLLNGRIPDTAPDIPEVVSILVAGMKKPSGSL